jgi:hypothetical protein
MSVSTIVFKIMLTEPKLECFDRISCKSADRWIENSGGRNSVLAVVLILRTTLLL